MNVQDNVLLFDQPMYDTIHLAAAAANGVFFAVPRGGVIGAGVKTVAETSLVQAGRLEAGNELTIDAITMHVLNDTSAGALPTWADYKAILSGSFTLQIGNTTFLEVPCHQIPAGPAEIVYMSNIAAAATEFNVQHGNSIIQNKYYLKNTLVLKSQESVSVTIGNFRQAIAAATRVCCVLWGQAIRPVR